MHFQYNWKSPSGARNSISVGMIFWATMVIHTAIEVLLFLQDSRSSENMSHECGHGYCGCACHKLGSSSWCDPERIADL